MTRQFDVIIKRAAEGYFIASVPPLAGCHNPSEIARLLMERIRETIALCLEVEDTLPEPLDFVEVQRVTFAARAKFRVSPASS